MRIFVGNGKIYHYKDKVISVCQTLDPNLYMIGYAKPNGRSSARIKSRNLPLCPNIDEAQKYLDEYAERNKLMEAIND